MHHFFHGGVRVLHAHGGVAMSFEAELVFVVVFFECFEDGVPVHLIGAIERVRRLELDIQNAVFGNQRVTIGERGFFEFLGIAGSQLRPMVFEGSMPRISRDSAELPMFCEYSFSMSR